ncbi:MAG: substrate-binding domain-containing protein, partial [Kiritimatiellae bacterium]|nr:substrate-binding domain-containing protein [Kiritimatiellia bacterium]
MKAQRSIGLVFDVRFRWASGEVRGIIAYARDHGRRWRFAGGPDIPATWAMLGRWRPDGVLFSTAVRHWRGPAPVVGALVPEPNSSAILDNGAIGALAARHFLERGFVSLAFVGSAGQLWSQERERAFEDAWRKAVAGRHDASFHRIDLTRSKAVSRTLNWGPVQSRLATWLATLPRPVGILACRDLMAVEVLQACRDQGRRVPEDVAIVGVDNDDLLCDLADPPLSSVSVPWEQIGYHMAARLDRLMRGDPAVRRLPHVGPGQLVVRRSSDVYAVADEAVVRACRFIRENAEDTIGVADVARAASVSRRGLERRFRQELGRSPFAEILRMRIEHAFELLRVTPLSLAAIAGRTGFATTQYLSAVFIAELG